MRVAMGALAVLAVIGGFMQIPGVDSALHNFLEPTFEDSSLYAQLEPAAGMQWLELIIGGAIGLAGIAIAYHAVGASSPSGRRRIQARFAALHKLFVNKWYFDEAIDFLFVRPAAWRGRFAHNTFERVFVNGALVGGVERRRARAVGRRARRCSRATCATTPRCCSSASPAWAPTS